MSGQSVAEADTRKEGCPARRGRPRRLRLDQILEAALKVGLQDLTMEAVARELGVAKAVLYNYVGNREELVQLASARLTRQRFSPEDRGQPWTVYVLEHCRAMFDALTGDGQLLESWMEGGYAPRVEVDATETWLGAMTKRGFSGPEALQLLNAVAILTVGAAAHYKHDQALKRAGTPRQESAKAAIAARPAAHATLLRQFVDVFAREPTEGNWEYSLYLLLRGVAAAREVLADPAAGADFEALSQQGES
ncbi:MAG: TetR family transcriptional regulator [Novosphingobium sp.]|nr:TetR family transcriptional regulator [Novosphingobium sp.]